EVLSLERHAAPVCHVSYSADGRRLATAHRQGKGKEATHEIRVWDADSGERLATLTGRGQLMSVAFRPRSDWLAWTCGDGTVNLVTLWDVEAGQATLTLRGATQRHWDAPFNPRIVFSPDGTQLAGTNWNESFSVWDADPADDTAAAEVRRKRRREAADARAVF